MERKREKEGRMIMLLFFHRGRMELPAHTHTKAKKKQMFTRKRIYRPIWCDLNRISPSISRYRGLKALEFFFTRVYF
jgi:hypothetical protein